MKALGELNHSTETKNTAQLNCTLAQILNLSISSGS